MGRVVGGGIGMGYAVGGGMGRTVGGGAVMRSFGMGNFKIIEVDWTTPNPCGGGYHLQECCGGRSSP